MTRERAKELLPVIEGYAKGEVVQWFDQHGNKWHDIRDPNWEDSHSLWRVKPQPLEVWAVIGNTAAYTAFRSRDDAEDFLRCRYPLGQPRIVKMREVDEVGQ